MNEEYKKLAEEKLQHGFIYETCALMLTHNEHDCKKEKCTPYKVTTDKNGNMTSWFK